MHGAGIGISHGFEHSIRLVSLGSVLNECLPLVVALHHYPRDFGGGLPVQTFMRFDVVMEYLHSLQDGRVHSLQPAHDLLSVADFPVQRARQI
jgi:hypothetical protein